MAEQLLGLSGLVGQQDPLQIAATAQDHPSDVAIAQAVEADASIPLPRYLFTFGLSPNGPASAEMLLSLLHHEGTKSVDARLKECGVKSIGQRLKIQTAVQRALNTSSAVPPPPRDMPRPVAVQVEGVIVVTGDVSSIKGPQARQLVQELVGSADRIDSLVALAGAGDREALTTELKRLGFKTGTRLKLEQALPAVAAERAAAEREAIKEAAREAALQQHLEEQRAERNAALAAEAELARVAEAARLEAEAAREAELDALYAQYEREMKPELSEVERLKQSRKTRREENEAKRVEEADAAAAAVPVMEKSAVVELAPLLVDVVAGGDGGVQGLDCSNAKLTADEEGDEAHEFVDLC